MITFSVFVRCSCVEKPFSSYSKYVQTHNLSNNVLFMFRYQWSAYVAGRIFRTGDMEQRLFAAIHVAAYLIYWNLVEDDAEETQFKFKKKIIHLPITFNIYNKIQPMF